MEIPSIKASFCGLRGCGAAWADGRALYLETEQADKENKATKGTISLGRHTCITAIFSEK
jgi:hypothetical protein